MLLYTVQCTVGFVDMLFSHTFPSSCVIVSGKSITYYRDHAGRAKNCCWGKSKYLFYNRGRPHTNAAQGEELNSFQGNEGFTRHCVFELLSPKSKNGIRKRTNRVENTLIQKLKCLYTVIK
jgi:hypothetical protein